MIRVPSLSFVLHHSISKQNFVFDLGIRSDPENFPPGVRDMIKKIFPVRIPQDVATSLTKGGLSPENVTHICLSHAHFDHIGDPRLFPRAQFFVGAETRTLTTPGYPTDPDSKYPTDLFPEGRTTYLGAPADKGWEPIGPFQRALDFYGDGSMYIVDAPGHLPGHLNLLARTSSDGGWVYLAGDSAHDWRLLTPGGGDILTGVNDEVRGLVCYCSHSDKAVAADHISRIKKLMEVPRVHVLLAHDGPWYEKNKGGEAFWPGKIPSL